MKKITALFLPALFLFAFTSCEKDGKTETKNIDVTLVKNESYSYAFSEGSKQNLEIEKQGTHYAQSDLSPELCTPDMIFTYRPAADYTGTDEVVISGSTSGGHCPMSSGENKTVYNFRFTVNLAR